MTVDYESLAIRYAREADENARMYNEMKRERDALNRIEAHNSAPRWMGGPETEDEAPPCVQSDHQQSLNFDMVNAGIIPGSASCVIAATELLGALMCPGCGKMFSHGGDGQQFRDDGMAVCGKQCLEFYPEFEGVR